MPIAPGYFQTVCVRAFREVREGEPVTIEGPCTLAFDGERERVLLTGETASLEMRRDGPWVIEVDRALEAAARADAFDVG